jgi:hypothetical protein
MHLHDAALSLQCLGRMKFVVSSVSGMFKFEFTYENPLRIVRSSTGEDFSVLGGKVLCEPVKIPPLKNRRLNFSNDLPFSGKEFYDLAYRKLGVFDLSLNFRVYAPPQKYTYLLVKQPNTGLNKRLQFAQNEQNTSAFMSHFIDKELEGKNYTTYELIFT